MADWSAVLAGFEDLQVEVVVVEPEETMSFFIGYNHTTRQLADAGIAALEQEGTGDMLYLPFNRIHRVKVMSDK